MRNKKNKTVAVLSEKNEFVGSCTPANARILKREGIVKSLAIQFEGYLFAVKLNPGFDFAASNMTIDASTSK